jgi:hypothetical protein
MACMKLPDGGVSGCRELAGLFSVLVAGRLSSGGPHAAARAGAGYREAPLP